MFQNLYDHHIKEINYFDKELKLIKEESNDNSDMAENYIEQLDSEERKNNKLLLIISNYSEENEKLQIKLREKNSIIENYDSMVRELEAQLQIFTSGEEDCQRNINILVEKNNLLIREISELEES